MTEHAAAASRSYGDGGGGGGIWKQQVQHLSCGGGGPQHSQVIHTGPRWSISAYKIINFSLIRFYLQ